MFKIQCGLDAFDHLGAAGAVQGLHVFDGLLDIFFCSKNRVRAQLRGVAGKANHLERVIGLQFFQGAFDGGLGGLDGVAAHAARTIQHEDHFHGGPFDV